MGCEHELFHSIFSLLSCPNSFEKYYPGNVAFIVVSLAIGLKKKELIYSCEKQVNISLTF